MFDSVHNVNGPVYPFALASAVGGYLTIVYPTGGGGMFIACLAGDRESIDELTQDDDGEREVALVTAMVMVRLAAERGE